jgi:hypothetical protein
MPSNLPSLRQALSYIAVGSLIEFSGALYIGEVGMQTSPYVSNDKTTYLMKVTSVQKR